MWVSFFTVQIECKMELVKKKDIRMEFFLTVLISVFSMLGTYAENDENIGWTNLKDWWIGWRLFSQEV